MVFTVAEIGANWHGDFTILERMVERCKKAGVNAVKFQALSDTLINRHIEWDWYNHASITPDNVDSVDKICRQKGMEWFCTPCYAQAIDFLDPYVKRWKIRSADNTKTDIIQKCIDTGKEVILSTARPIGWLDKFTDVKQIYCISKYPTDYGELNFDMIKLLKGYSNHCLDPLACLKAVRYGAEYLEFHLTDNRDDFAIDNKVSFSYSQMEEIMKWI